MRTIPVSRFFLVIIPFLLLSLNCLNVQAAQDNLNATQAEARKGGYQLIEFEALSKLYQNNKEELFLVDTRQEWEYHSGYILGAVNFPMEPTWLSRMTQRGALEQFLGPDKSKTIVFY
jgi:hypothetical protein